MIEVGSFAMGRWVGPGSGARELRDAATGEMIGRAGDGALDMAEMIQFAREIGGRALRAMTFHDRARMLKALALHLNANKARLYDLSFTTGATKSDHLFDIDGGIGTLFVFSSKGRREMPEGHVLRDGDLERFGKEGVFLGQHIWVPRRGVALHVNAFNFPVWGMLEKIAPALLAGVPSIVKPATATAHVTELCVRLMLEAGVLPKGALQLVTGGIGDALEHLGPQDCVTFTGSAATARLLRANAPLLENAVPFTAEQDSLNASVLGPDAVPGTPEFDLFSKEVVREMTVKAGQKCTAIRRIIAPEALVEPLGAAISARLGKVVIGNPRSAAVTMGALVSQSQRADVLATCEALGAEAEPVFQGAPDLVDARAETGAFVAPRLYRCADPDSATLVHTREAFGPVSTLMGYRDTAHAAALANRGGGSLVASLVTHDPAFAAEMVGEIGAWHGRVYINDRTAMSEATGHGAPMPHMIHGGPGRAGGGEELGGIRAVRHFMQRVAVQGSPEMITAVTGRWTPGAETHEDGHPFRKRFGELRIGQRLETGERKITQADIDHFADFTGDTFYAHTDAAAAARNPFFPGRVAHGYLLLSFAAGLFVDPDEGPVLANTGLDGLAFQKPVVAGERVKVALTVMEKKGRTEDYGEVRWHVEMTDSADEVVATYELLTMVAR